MAVNPLDYIGYYGPILNFGLVIGNIYRRIYYLFAFIIGSIVNYFINVWIKDIVQEPRPFGQIPFIDHEQLTGTNLYGFPSGHAQMAVFAWIFIAMVSAHQPFMIIITGMISAMTVFQRWKYRRHSAMQLFAGTVIGGAFAWFVVKLTQYILYEKYHGFLL